jgi:hypothetical protein
MTDTDNLYNGLLEQQQTEDNQNEVEDIVDQAAVDEEATTDYGENIILDHVEVEIQKKNGTIQFDGFFDARLRNIHEKYLFFCNNEKQDMKKGKNVRTSTRLMCLAIYSYLKRVQLSESRINASIEVAKTLYPNSKNYNYRARKIRDEALKYLYSGNILPSAQGKHTKFRSIIFEEGAQQLIKEALRNIPELQRTPEKFISVCETDIFPNIAAVVGL